MSQGEDRIQSPLTAVRILCATANATPGRPSALAFPSSSPSSMLRVRACMASVVLFFSGWSGSSRGKTKRTTLRIGTSRRAASTSSSERPLWAKTRSARPRTQPTRSGCPRRCASSRRMPPRRRRFGSSATTSLFPAAARSIERDLAAPSTDSTPPNPPRTCRSAS